MVTHSDGVVMLPTAAATVRVTELYDDLGKAIYMIKIYASGSEITVGRKRASDAAEAIAEQIRGALPTEIDD